VRCPLIPVRACLLQDMEAATAQLPWILGAFGTVGLDLGIFLQARALQRASGSHFAPSSKLSFQALPPSPEQLQRAEGGGGKAQGQMNPLRVPLVSQRLLAE
jgi:hypothetical protein